MKTTTQVLDQADEKERDLTLLTEEIADMLLRPASSRDSRRLAHLWEDVARMRSGMRVIGGSLRKIEKPVRGRMAAAEYRDRRNSYDRARTFQRRLRQWDEIERLVQRHVEPERTPLLGRPLPTRKDALLTQIYEAFHRLANSVSQDQQALDHGCFADIALPIQPFDRLMSASYRVGLAQDPRRALRFLDVGCGGGTKVFAATRFFAQSDGLELDPGYADAARRTLHMIGASRSTIIQADALTFGAYSDYDVIYFYRPLRTDALLAEMELRIIETARPGTILVAPYDVSLAVRPGMPGAQIDGPIFVTGMKQAEADQLRQDAEATGTDILDRSAHLSFDAGYWAPILDAASFSGSESR